MEAGRRSVLLIISVVAARAAFAGVGLDDLGGSLALTSDYIYHGISQTCGDPAAQADCPRPAEPHTPAKASAADCPPELR